MTPNTFTVTVPTSYYERGQDCVVHIPARQLDKGIRAFTVEPPRGSRKPTNSTEVSR